MRYRRQHESQKYEWPLCQEHRATTFDSVTLGILQAPGGYSNLQLSFYEVNLKYGPTRLDPITESKLSLGYL